MKPSRTQLIEQIERYGRPWGLIPMKSVLGDILVAEEIPVKIPLTDDISILVKVNRDITAISAEYPFSRLLATRGSRKKRVTALANELAFVSKMKKKEAAQRRVDELYGEMTDDFRRANRTTIWLGNK